MTRALGKHQPLLQAPSSCMPGELCWGCGGEGRWVVEPEAELAFVPPWVAEQGCGAPGIRALGPQCPVAPPLYHCALGLAEL